MIRYWNEPYEGSDDQVNDTIRAEQEQERTTDKSEKTEKAKKNARTFGKK